jgi:predicted NBD/HSP70 family sugar kinase
MPGVVDADKGEALFIPHFKWKDVKVKEILEKATGIAVSVDNDANASALAELWFGQPEIREVRDFVMVLVEEGVGTGIVYDGQIYRGNVGTAGEFGHMTIGQNAPVACATGSRQCWEAFASERAALARYRIAAEKAESSPIENTNQLVEHALAGDELARTALKETAHYLGIGIANIVQGMGPEMIIVAGALAKTWSLIADDVKSSIEKSLCRDYHSTKVVASSLGASSNLMGAISLILAPKFGSVSIN